jgi:hypothetical protein
MNNVSSLFPSSFHSRSSVARLCAIVLFVVASIAGPTQSSAAATAAPVTQKTFPTAEAAVDAFVAALRTNDSAALTEIFGPDSEDLVSSGDPVADSNGRARFVAAYDAAHELVPGDDGSVVLEVGEDAWPSPIPLVQNDGKWRFDTDAGIDEVVYRRIGRNELGTIETCLGIAAAQHDYAAEGHDGQPAGIYAKKLMSDPGKHNGLYWEPVEGERASPVGPFLAAASAEGYKKATGSASGTSAPYHGYLYKALTGQGPAANGGAKQYLDKQGQMTGGFAVVAYPVEYQASGVKTFIVNQDGVVYQKDLGPNTAQLAAAMTVFNPDGTWTKVEDLVPDQDEAHNVAD